MSDSEMRHITIHPVISYPREAEVGKTYLMSIDVQTEYGAETWPYEQEDFALHCILDTKPLFNHKAFGEPVIVLNRFGGTYGPASFLLTATTQPQTGAITVSFVNEQGLLVQNYSLPSIRVTNVRAEIESIKRESLTNAQNLMNSIVAILDTDESVRGTGFLISESHILTCAHVINSVNTNQGKLIYVRPHDDLNLLPARIVTLSDNEDVAILELDSPPPEKMQSVTCGFAKDVESHTFRSIGFISKGKANTAWATGSINRKVNTARATGMKETPFKYTQLLELESDNVEAGMSGAPVLDTFGQRVIGMISMVNKEAQSVSSSLPLSSEDFNRLVTILASLPEVRIARDRHVFLNDAFSDSPRKKEILMSIDLEGAPRSFAARIIHRLTQFGQIEPGREALGFLINVIIEYNGGESDSKFLEGLFQTYQIWSYRNSVFAIPMERVKQVWPDLPISLLDTNLHQYCQDLVEQLSSAPYQIDSRFVQLALLVDQGAEFVTSNQHRRYNSLETLLADIDEQVIVILGPPGSGKTSLLRYLQYEQALSIMDSDSPSKIPFFVSLNAYRAISQNEPPLTPREWLVNEWQIRYPDAPAFTDLFEQGDFLLLLDGLNEIPHRNAAEYRSLIEKWRSFLHQNAGNTVVFSCRSLDYSVPLSTETMPVRHVQIEPLSPAQIRQFLQQYLGKKVEAVWEILSRDNQQLELLSTPYFLHLFVEEIIATGEIRIDRASLITNFIRAALRREIETDKDSQKSLFYPNTLLNKIDVRQVIESQWNTPYDLPERGILISKLALLAFSMQGGLGNETQQTSIPEPEALALLNHERADDLINAGIRLNVLHRDTITLEISFSHHLLQEFFAARHLNTSVTLFGFNASWMPNQAELMLFPIAQAELIKILSFQDPSSIHRIANENPEAVFIIRAFLSFGGRSISPEQFVNDTVGDVMRAIQILNKQELWIELHNEPNLQLEGLGNSWYSGKDFNQWYLKTLFLYRERLPNQRFIFPGLSPGPEQPNLRQADRPFLEACRESISKSDALGMHVYWSDPHFPIKGHPDSGIDLVKDYVARFPDKTIWITEADNQLNSDWMDKASQYITFWQELGKIPTVRGVSYSFPPEAPSTSKNEERIGRIFAELVASR